MPTTIVFRFDGPATALASSYREAKTRLLTAPLWRCLRISR